MSSRYGGVVGGKKGGGGGGAGGGAAAVSAAIGAGGGFHHRSNLKQDNKPFKGSARARSQLRSKSEEPPPHTTHAHSSASFFSPSVHLLTTDCDCCGLVARSTF
jgi:hypothetical protein